MNKLINNNFTLKKIIYTILLLGVSVILSIVINYKTTGVFNIGDRKLPIYSVDTKEKKVAITFDLSWGDDYTNQILDILDKYNVKATFFVVGGWVDENNDKLREIKKRGHEIGNHSNMHPDMAKISKEKIVQEIAACDAKISSITGERTKLFRFPEGSYNSQAVEAAESTNHYCIQWDVDSIDWKQQGADLEYNRVIKGTKPGSIILFHNTAKYTPQTLPRAIEKLKASGYSFVKVTDLIYKDNFHLDATGRQIMD